MRNIFFGARQKAKRSSTRLTRARLWQETPSNAPTKSIPNWVIRGVIVVLIVLVSGWLLFFSPVFSVSEIKVEGEVSPATRQIIQTLYGKNIFLLGNRSTENQLLAHEPTLKALHIIRGIPRTIEVEVIERTSVASWQSAGQWFLVDGEGMIYKKVDRPQTMAIIDDANIPVDLGKKIVSKEFLSFVETVKNLLPSAMATAFVEAHVGETTFSVTVKTELGLDILFDTTQSIERQFDALKRIWFQKKTDIQRYIDVRVEGYVYYQ